MLKPIDDLIEHLKGVNPYGKTEAVKLWEALKRLSDTSMRVGAIDGKQIADGTLEFSKLASGVIAGGDWNTNIVFSASSNTVVAWTSGIIIFGDNTKSGTIAAGNSGTISTLTYIYYDSNISKISLQITTDYKKVVGNGRILLCTVKDASAGQNAFFFPVNGGQLGVNETIIGPNSISSSLLQANSVIAAKILAGEVTASKISVTNLAAISADLGSITAGTVTGATLRTSSSNPRIEITSTDLKAYSAGGSVLTQIAISDGYIKTIQVQAVSNTQGLQLFSADGTTGLQFDNQAINFYCASAGSRKALFNSSGDLQLDSGSLKLPSTKFIYFAGVTTGGNFGGSGNSILGYIGTNEVFRCVDPGSSTTTSSLFLKYNGAPSQVLFGAADSGGVGYRLLRVAN